MKHLSLSGALEFLDDRTEYLAGAAYRLHPETEKDLTTRAGGSPVSGWSILLGVLAHADVGVAVSVHGYDLATLGVSDLTASDLLEHATQSLTPPALAAAIYVVSDVSAMWGLVAYQNPSLPVAKEIRTLFRRVMSAPALDVPTFQKLASDFAAVAPEAVVKSDELDPAAKRAQIELAIQDVEPLRQLLMG